MLKDNSSSVIIALQNRCCFYSAACFSALMRNICVHVSIAFLSLLQRERVEVQQVLYKEYIDSLLVQSMGLEKEIGIQRNTLFLSLMGCSMCG